MKQYITADDLKTLTDSQKKSLNAGWLPEKYDHVLATVCKDVENDVYEDVEFIVGEILLNGTQITLKRLRLPVELTDDNAGEAEASDETESCSNEEEFDIQFDDPGDYFQKEACMPLFNIGQLISLLRASKAGQNGFSIGIPPANDPFFDQGFTLDDRFGEVAKAEELTDLLFDMIKTML